MAQIISAQIITMLDFIGSAIIFLLGYYVYLKDPKRSLNKVFFFFSLAAMCWGLIEGAWVLMYGDISLITREIILKTKSPFKILLFEMSNDIGFWLVASFLHLSLIVIGKKEILRKKIILFLIYFPPILLFTSMFICDFVFFLKLGQDIVVGGIELLYLLGMSLLFELYLFMAIFFLFKKYFVLKSLQEKRKLRYFLIGIMIPAVFGSLFTIILPVVSDIRIFEWLTFPLYTLGYIFIAFGVLRYGLFIDYRLILETIFQRLSELVIVTDKEGFILSTNDVTPLNFHYKKEEFIGKKIGELLKGGKRKWEEILEKTKKAPLEGKISFLTKENKSIPFLLTVSRTKEGVIFVGKSIKEIVEYEKKLEKEVEARTRELSEAKSVLEIKVKARTRELQELTKRQEEIIKKRTKEIRERMAELEKFHKLAIGRELRMIELKEKIKELEKKLRDEKKKFKS